MSEVKAFIAPRIFDGDNWFDGAALTVADEQIANIVPIASLPKSTPVLRLDSGFIAPGFVDLQVNGGDDVLLNNMPDIDGISRICAAHTRLGTTSLLPTLITDTPEIRDRAIEAAISAAKQKIPGFAGLHLEGPHISHAKKGAHDPALIRAMTEQDLTVLVTARQNLPSLLLTIAPESVTKYQVRALVDAGIVVSIGHSDAGFEAANELISAGVSMATHLFNAMSQISPRQPGIVGAALDADGLYAGLIADGHHVHATAIHLALRAKKPPGKIFLVSDAMSFVGTETRELSLNGRTIYRRNGKLTLADGTLAGADLDLATAVAFMHRELGLDMGEVLRMASTYPGRAIGNERLGTLRPKSSADFVWLDDDLSVMSTWIGGRQVARPA